MSLFLRFVGAAFIGYSMKPELLYLVFTIIGLIMFALGVAIDTMLAYDKKGNKQDVDSDN